MNVFINGRFLTQRVTGVQRYAEELIKALDSQLETHENINKKINFILLTPKIPSLKSVGLKNIKIKQVGVLKGHLWEQIFLPIYTLNKPLINLCNSGPILKRNFLIVIHDVAVFERPLAFSRLFRIWYRFLIKRLSKNSRQVITVSRFSRDEILKHCKVNSSKIKVIYEGHEHILANYPDEKILSKNNLSKNSYVLSVSSLNKNKNFITFLNAANSLKNQNLTFILVGGGNSKVFKGKGGVSSNENVKYLGYVNDGELMALYQNAVCFVFPSLYEGFGLPPLEAMACGCPVIVSKASSLPEVCGNSALYIDPHNYKDIAAKIISIIKDKDQQELLKNKGKQQSELFLWSKCSQELLQSIEANFL